MRYKKSLSANRYSALWRPCSLSSGKYLMSVESRTRSVKVSVIVIFRRDLVVIEEVFLMAGQGFGGFLQSRGFQVLDVDLESVDQGFEIFGGTVTERCPWKSKICNHQVINPTVVGKELFRTPVVNLLKPLRS